MRALPAPITCAWRANHSQAQYPGKKPKQTLPERTGYMLLMQHGDESFWRSARRAASGGLYCFPQFEDLATLRARKTARHCCR